MLAFGALLFILCRSGSIKYFCISKPVIKKYKHKCKVKCKQWFLEESKAIRPSPTHLYFYLYIFP